MRKDNIFEGVKGCIRINEALRKHTTFKIGGSARFFAEPKDISDLKLLINLAKRYKIQTLVIGSGSNILVSDKGINAVVLRLSSPYFKKAIISKNKIIAGAGVPVGRLICLAAKHGLSGLEFLAGIPATVGGALAMNAGAWGKCIGQVISELTVLKQGTVKVLNKQDLVFKYRDSGLAGSIILNACFKLSKGDKGRIKRTIKSYLDKRKRNQDFTSPSAGCVFRNPPGDFAGRLIEACGLKGKKLGMAQISIRHANFIINSGGATAADVTGLMGLAKKKVKNEFGIILEPEIRIWQ